MPLKNRLLAFTFLLCMLCSLGGCDLAPVVTIKPTSTTAVATSQANNATTPTLNTWNKAAPGVEVRYEHWAIHNNDDVVTIVRLDLHRVHLAVGYQPTQPLLMSEWVQQEHPLAIINGGYFDQQNNATGLLISSGHVYGSSYAGFGGMLSVDVQGNVTLRSLRQQPYDPNNEQLEQATQSSPMLMLGGQRTQFNSNAVSSRRSIVAMDKQGRLLLIASPSNAFTLDDIADLLASSDLSLDVALNLDGGASTGLYVNAGSPHVQIDSFAKLPIVVIVNEGAP